MKKTALLLFTLISLLKFTGQTNYYVATSGVNSNNGTVTSPWATVQFGLNQLSSGDTLNVATGTYIEKLTIPISNICLRRKAGNAPIISAQGLTNPIAIINIIIKNNVTIDGFELKNNIGLDAQGIVVEGPCQNITIKNNKIHDIHFSSNVNAPVNETTNAQGIIVFGNHPSIACSNLLITNNQVYNCRLGYSEGLAVNGNVDGFEVSYNRVYDLTNIGIVAIGHEGTCPVPANDQARNGVIKFNMVYNCLSPYATSGGLYTDGARDVVIENNTSYRNGYGIEIGCENIGKTSSGIKARNNIIYNNEVAGLAIGGFDYPSGSGKVMNSSFTNNTCFKNDFTNSNNGEIYLSYSENCVIENNIFVVRLVDFVSAENAQLNLVFNYNVVYSIGGANNLQSYWNGLSYNGFASFQTGTGTNSNSIFGTPDVIYISEIDPDAHIIASSICVNAGNPAFVAALGEKDMDGQNRTNGRVDIGADEYNTSNANLTLYESTKVVIYPNPTFDFITFESLDGAEKIEIFNILGEKMIFENLKSKLNVSQFSTGIYFIEITTNNRLERSSFVVK